MSAYSSISQLQQAYRQKKVTLLEVVDTYLQKVQADKTQSYLTICDERARAKAKKLAQVLDQGAIDIDERYPLLGVPMGVKDNLVLEGVRTTCASRILENYVPPYTATVLDRIEKAGALILGKLNMDEFAMGSSSENSAFRPVLHPTHPDRVAGGSSGGSAAAVRAGSCLVSLGSDTGGSIRLPASFCGVVGLKPTYGRVSRYGLVAFASSLDQVGPLGQNVEDVARVFKVIAGKDPLDSTSVSLPVPEINFQEKIQWKKIRIGLPKEYLSDAVSPAVRQAMEAAKKFFEKQGAQFQEVSLPHTRFAVATYYLIAVSEASSNLARFDGIRYGVRPKETERLASLEEFYKKVRSYFGTEVKRRILLGTFALSSGYADAYYLKACQVRRLIQQDFLKVFDQKIDFLLTPTAPQTAFKLGEKTRDPLQMYLMDEFTVPASLAGIPALSLPAGEDKEGLPVGIQLLGRSFEEDFLLRVAQAFEKEGVGN